MRNFQWQKACWCICTLFGGFGGVVVQLLRMYHYWKMLGDWGARVEQYLWRFLDKYCTWYWSGCGLDLALSQEMAVPKRDPSWSINPYSVLTIWKDNDDFSSRVPLAIEWTLDSYCITSSEWAKVMGISVISFNHLGIVVVKDFLTALCCHYPFRVWLVEDWLWRNGIMKSAVE